MSRIGFPVGRNYKRGSKNPKKWEFPKILKNLGVQKSKKSGIPKKSKNPEFWDPKNEGSKKSKNLGIPKKWGKMGGVGG